MSSQRFGPYSVGSTIGRGTFAKVKIAVHETTKARVALKIIPRKVFEMDPHSAKKIMREIKIMHVLRHPHITRLYDVLQTKHDIVLVMEYVGGGELFDYISRRGRLEEAKARVLFQQLAGAIAYCHRYRVAHRDVKPENIMLEQGTHHVKLSDFGLSSITHDGRFFETSCGTPNYASPEVVSGRLYGGPETDVWSCGVVLYAMLCGCLPFDDSNVSSLFRKIQSAEYIVPSFMSREASDLLHRMLIVNPMERATMEQVMQHPFLRPEFPQYILSLHYEAVLATMCFSTEHQVHEAKLDEEVLELLAARFHTTPDAIGDLVVAEEAKLPSMRAVISESHPDSTRRYPAAHYFETFSSVLDAKLWPTPLVIPLAEVVLREDSHDTVVSYHILTQRKLTRVGPAELTNKSFGESATSVLKSASSQGYGTLNANSLHHRSENSSLTNSFAAKPSDTVVRQPQATSLGRLVPAQLQAAAASLLSADKDAWMQGFNNIARPFLPLKSSKSHHTLLGRLLHIREQPISELRALPIQARPMDAVPRPRSEVPRQDKSLLQPRTLSRLGKSMDGSTQFFPTLPLSRSGSTFALASVGDEEDPSAPSMGNETALDRLYNVDTVTRFGNDFIRHGVYFSGTTALQCLTYVYEAMKEEGMQWRVIYDYYFSVIRFPNVKLQVKVYKVSTTEQIVDVKVSAQSGMDAFDVAMALLERIRNRAVQLAAGQVVTNVAT